MSNNTCISPSANMINSDSSMNPEDLASQSVRLKEEQLRREEEKVRDFASVGERVSYARNVVARDRASRPARDQREEAGVVGKGRIAQVSSAS